MRWWRSLVRWWRCLFQGHWAYAEDLTARDDTGHITVACRRCHQAFRVE